MKLKLLKKYNKFLAFLLSLIGVGGACSSTGCMYGTPAEYGTPHATFKVYGKVSNENDEAIRHIRVVMSYDTSYTDENGNYQVEVEEFPVDQTFIVSFDDIDGDSNNSYESIDTTASFIEPEFTNGDGSWDSGETSKELNIKLKEDNQ